MSNQIYDSTNEALTYIRHPRLFVSERAYQGSFQIGLTLAFDRRGMLADPMILLESEYQKSPRQHGMSQRPDLIFHIPTEVSNASVDENNFAVWAFKLNARVNDALDDFAKLDMMFDNLRYPIGFFINIGQENNFLDLYKGPYPDRLFATGVILRDSKPVFDLKRACC